MRKLDCCELAFLERKVMPPAQHQVVEKLMGKGWIEPFLYHRSVHLGLSMVALRRKTGHYARDWHRPGIRITPTGRIISDIVRVGGKS